MSLEPSSPRDVKISDIKVIEYIARHQFEQESATCAGVDDGKLAL